MIRLSVTSNAREVLRSVEQIQRGEMRKSISRAINHAIDGVEVEAKRSIRKIYKVKLATLSKAFKKYRSSNQTLSGSIEASGRPLAVAGFGPRQVKAGVTVDVKGQRKLIRHAFIQTIKGALESEYKGVFIRVGKARYPIKSVQTVSVPGMFDNSVVVESLNVVAIERFESELLRQINLILKG